MSSQISDRRPGEAPAIGGWPLQSGTVPPLADCYSPRPETGFGPMSNLAAGEIAVLTRPEVTDGQSLALAGGTGKTQLAVAFAHALWQGGAADLLVWVPATSRDSIITGYAQALSKIGVADPGDDQNRLADRFLSWLAETSRPGWSFWTTWPIRLTWPGCGREAPPEECWSPPGSRPRRCARRAGRYCRWACSTAVKRSVT